jgi:hypothetical protein
MFVSTVTVHFLFTSIRYKFSYLLHITPEIQSVDKHIHYQYEGGPNLHNDDDDDEDDNIIMFFFTVTTSYLAKSFLIDLFVHCKVLI